jgi:predicted nucleic acid-binding protein
MPEAVANTTPLLYLHRIEAIHWLRTVFTSIWVPTAVAGELAEGRRKGYDAPDVGLLTWLQIVEPRSTPHEWLTLDLGPGELAAMALALENPGRVLLLDDALARRTAQAAGLTVWGTLRVLLESKSAGLTQHIAPLLDRLRSTGMWISDDVGERILRLAGEA